MLLYPFVIDNKNKLAYVLIAIIASILSVILYFVSENFVVRYTPLQLILFAFFLSTGLFFLFVVIRHYYPLFLRLLKSKNTLNNKQYRNGIFLFSWFLIGFLFNTFVAGGAVRYVTILIPPMTIMYFNIVDNYNFFKPKRLRNFIFMGLALTLALSIVVAYADYELAKTYKDFSNTASQYKTKDNKVWYLGHLGFQYYMDMKGYNILGVRDNSLQKGDILIKAQLPSPRNFTPQLKERIVLVDTISYESNLLLKVQNPKARAGFYTYGGGFLPYSFSNSNLEDFEIYKVVK